VKDVSCPLLIYFIIIAGLMLLLLPSRSEPLPRRARAPKRWFGGDAAVLAAKRGERPPTGARLGGGSGGGGGTSSMTTSSADKPPESDSPASVIPEPISVLLATCCTAHVLLKKTPAMAPAMKVFFAVLLLASVVVVVEADRILLNPRKKADDAAEKQQKEVEVTVGANADHANRRTDPPPATASSAGTALVPSKLRFSEHDDDGSEHPKHIDVADFDDEYLSDDTKAVDTGLLPRARSDSSQPSSAPSYSFQPSSAPSDFCTLCADTCTSSKSSKAPKSGKQGKPNQPLHLRRGLILEGIALEKKKAGISASNLASTDGSDGDRDAAVSASTRIEPTNSAVGGGAVRQQQSCNQSIHVFSGNTPLNIPDGGLGSGQQAIATIEVTDDCVIDDVNVIIAIDHTWLGDLTMTLTSPDGITAGLVERPGLTLPEGCCGAGFDLLSSQPITFDDGGSSNPEQMGSFGDVYSSDGPYYSAGGFAGPPYPPGASTLTDMVGGRTQGIWNLTVSDGADYDTGIIQSVTLNINAYERPSSAPSSAPSDFCTLCAATCTSAKSTKGPKSGKQSKASF